MGESNWMNKMNTWRAFFVIYCVLRRATCNVCSAYWAFLTSGTPHRSFICEICTKRTTTTTSKQTNAKKMNLNLPFKPENGSDHDSSPFLCASSWSWFLIFLLLLNFSWFVACYRYKSKNCTFEKSTSGDSSFRVKCVAKNPFSRFHIKIR